MSAKVIDDSKLSSIFNIISKEELLKEEDLKTSETPKQESNVPLDGNNKEEYINNELAKLLKTSNDILNTAHEYIESSPDGENLSAAASIIKSTSDIISEFNKSILQEKRLKSIEEIEKMKIEAKEKMTRLRCEHDKQLKIGDGNTINITNNQLIPFQQESIIRQLLVEEKNNKNTIDIQPKRLN